MNTQTHMLMGAVLYGRLIPKRIWAGLSGGLMPDLPMYIIIAALKYRGVSSDRIFGQYFYADWWQIANAIGHSFIIWAGLLVLGLVSQRRFPKGIWPEFLSVASASALTHSAIDFLCHRHDAHMHFWPLSRWKFVSPVSYYDPEHFGVYFSFAEAALGIVMAGYLYRKFQNTGARFALGVAICTYFAIPLAFLLMTGMDHE